MGKSSVRRLVAVSALLLVAACASSKESTTSSGAASSGGTPSQTNARAASTDADLDALFAGKASQDDMTAERVLESSLSAAELDHVRKVDWLKLTGAAVLADPALLKAMEALVGLPREAREPCSVGGTTDQFGDWLVSVRPNAGVKAAEFSG